MRTRGAQIFAVVAALGAGAVAAACGSTKVATVPAARPSLQAPDLDGVDAPDLPWRPLVHSGEYALYDLKFRGLVVGEIEVAAGQPGLIDGVPAHYVAMRGTTAGIAEMFGTARLDATAEITADPRRPRTIRGRYRTLFRGKEKTGTTQSRYPEKRHNPISALIGLRGWRPEPGESARLLIGKGRGTELLLVARGGQVRGPFRRPARRLVGLGRRGGGNRSKTAPVEIWISDDADRIPLLIRIGTRWGDVTLELVGYRRERR